MTSKVIPPETLAGFAVDVLTAAGADHDQAAGVAEVLVWADTFGRPNQGVWRLPILCKRLEAGMFGVPCRLRVRDHTPSVAVIDGGNGIGHYVGRRAVDAAIERAGTTGIAAVGVSDSNFLGALGYYVSRIAEHNMLGLALNNSFPKVAPHGGVRPVLGTNPMAFAAPRRDGTTIIVDLATAASAGSDITKAAELGQPLPEGIAIDSDGKPLTDPSRVGEGALLPLGGAKGYALGLMVEIMAGVATGAGISHGVKSMYKDFDQPGNSGHFFLAINIAALMPLDAFHDRMEILVDALKAEDGVMLPGEARWNAHGETEGAGGVELDDSTTAALTDLADRYGVEIPWDRPLLATKGAE